jgi:hypothetical protein
MTSSEDTPHLTSSKRARHATADDKLDLWSNINNWCLLSLSSDFLVQRGNGQVRPLSAYKRNNCKLLKCVITSPLYGAMATKSSAAWVCLCFDGLMWPFCCDNRAYLEFFHIAICRLTRAVSGECGCWHVFGTSDWNCFLSESCHWLKVGVYKPL